MKGPFRAQSMRTSAPSLPGDGREPSLPRVGAQRVRSTGRGHRAPPGSTGRPWPELLPGQHPWWQQEGSTALLCRRRGALGGAGAAGLGPVEGAEAGALLREQPSPRAGGQPQQAVHPHDARLPARRQPAVRVQVGAEAHLREGKGSGGRGRGQEGGGATAPGPRHPAATAAIPRSPGPRVPLTLCTDSSCRRSRLSSAFTSCACILRMGSRPGKFLKLRCEAAAPPWPRALGAPPEARGCHVPAGSACPAAPTAQPQPHRSRPPSHRSRSPSGPPSPSPAPPRPLLPGPCPGIGCSSWSPSRCTAWSSALPAHRPPTRGGHRAPDRLYRWAVGERGLRAGRGARRLLRRPGPPGAEWGWGPREPYPVPQHGGAGAGEGKGVLP